MAEPLELKGAGAGAAAFEEKAAINDYRAGAIEAENLEHNMTVLESVRAYPMASFWAFVMSFCIVSASPFQSIP